MKDQFTEIHLWSDPFEMPTDIKEKLPKNRKVWFTASSSLSTNISVFELKEQLLWMLTHRILVLEHIPTRPYSINFHSDEPLKQSLDGKKTHNFA